MVFLISVCLLLLLAVASHAATQVPISLHPINSRYFHFRGKPTVLITSAEHYGAVVNLDFKYIPYLDELKRCGFNYTRIFAGPYCEDPAEKNIINNTLAPEKGRFICPWARSNQSGYAGGGNKFDLQQWNKAYFDRLHSFMKEASRRNIIVEATLFCPYYGDAEWNLSPLNAQNNINGVGNTTAHDTMNLKHHDLTEVQEAMVRKIVSELRSYDNLFYEICNEPYFGGVTLEWQKHIAAVIAETQMNYTHKHLIAQNIANITAKVENPDPNVSILNFHYANPPHAIPQNSHFKGVIGCDETGFKGKSEQPYIQDGWEFIMAGGGLYNNLDYSFSTKSPQGLATPQAPGSGGKSLRSALSVLKKFIYSFRFIEMSPDKSVKLISCDDKAVLRAVSSPNSQIAAYVRGGTKAVVGVELAKGRYLIRWVETKSGRDLASTQINHSGGPLSLQSPTYHGDVALSVVRSR